MTEKLYNNEYGKELFEIMLDNWMIDHSPEMDDLEIGPAYWDDEVNGWIAEATDAEGRGYMLIDDGAGNIEIG